MKNIVITGSTRGIGYGLAHSFLARGCRVVISGRTQAAVDETCQQLKATYGTERILGQPCDVTNLAQVEQLWHAAAARFGSVDIWINNAGIGHPLTPFWEMPQALLESVVAVDVMGSAYGAQVAIREMIKQGHGFLYNMEGFGSNGEKRNGLLTYGMTKYAVRYLTQALVKETKETPVRVGAISPGIVITDFITGQYKDDPAGLERAKRVFNILGDKVETVTPWLADKVLANTKHGAQIAWLTPLGVMGRFLTAGLRKRDLFA